VPLELSAACRPFVPVKYRVMPHDLLESTLFGTRPKGAFTSADRVEEGSVEVADKGTRFWEIEHGEMETTA